MRLHQERTQFWHGDVRLPLNSRYQEAGIRLEPTVARRASLPRRQRRSGPCHAPQQLDRKALAYPEMTRRRASRVPGLNKGHNP